MSMMAETVISTTSTIQLDQAFNDYARPGPISLIVSTISTITIGYIFIRLVVTAKRAQIKLKRSDQFFAFLCIFCYWCYSIQFASQSLYGVIHNNQHTFNTTVCLIYFNTAQWFNFGKNFAYLFFISRLYHTFHGSVFAIKKQTLIIFSICTIIPNLVGVGLMTYLVIEPMIYLTNPAYTDITSKVDINSFTDCGELITLNKLWPMLRGMGIAILLLWELITSIIILRLFVRKLTLLSIAFREIDVMIKHQSKVSTKNQKRHNTNKVFFSLAIRTTNIVILSIVTGYLTIFIYAARVGEYWLVSDHIIRVLTVYMMYSEKTYNKIFCCNTCCFNCCSKICYCCCLKPKDLADLPQHIQLEINMKINDKNDTNDISPSTPSDSTIKSIPIPMLTYDLNDLINEKDTTSSNLQQDNVNNHNINTSNSVSIQMQETKNNNIDKTYNI